MPSTPFITIPKDERLPWQEICERYPEQWVASTLVISHLLGLLHGGTIDALVDLDLRSVEHRHVVPTRRNFAAFNPGYVSAAGR